MPKPHRKAGRNRGLNYLKEYTSLIIYILNICSDVTEYLSCRISVSQMTSGRIEKDIPLVKEKEDSGVMKDVEKKEGL